MQVKKIISECIKEVLKESLLKEENVVLQTKDAIYSALESYDFKKMGTPPRDYMEYYLSGFATVGCNVDGWKRSVFLERYYDSERLDTIPGHHIEKHIPIPKEHSPEFIEKIVLACIRMKETINNDESIFGGMDDMDEGFDPQSNGGPNPAATEGTQDNPYPAWNARMRQMEEDKEDDLSNQSRNVDANIDKMEKDPSYRPFPFNSPTQMNSLEIYKSQGFKAGKAMDKKDQGLYSSITAWFNNAIKLEKGEYATKAREVFNTAYKEGSGANRPPVYFREDKKKAIKESVDVNVPEKKCYNYTAPEDKTTKSNLPPSGEEKYYKQEPGGTMGAVNVAEDISSNPHGRYAQEAGADGFDPRKFGVNETDKNEETWSDMMSRVDRDYHQAINDPDKKYFNYKRSYPDDDGFDDFRKEIGPEKVNEFLSKFGLGPNYKPQPKKTYECPNCKGHNAVYKSIHEDTDMEENELNCPDCEYPSTPKSFQEIRNQYDPDGTKHDLTLKCVKCGNTQTCKCSKPKRKMFGICDECSKLK